MKLRNGFVSNSSSSSYLIITKTPLTKRFLYELFDINSSDIYFNLTIELIRELFFHFEVHDYFAYDDTKEPYKRTSETVDLHDIDFYKNISYLSPLRDLLFKPRVNFFGLSDNDIENNERQIKRNEYNEDQRYSLSDAIFEKWKRMKGFLSIITIDDRRDDDNYCSCLELMHLSELFEKLELKHPDLFTFEYDGN